MNESDGLRKKIARLGEDIPLTHTGRRRLSATATDDLALLVLREIRETVLPRTLILEIGGDEVLRIEVSGGRVLSLATDAATVDGAEFDRPDEFAGMVATGIHAALGTATEAAVHSARVATDHDPAGLRCPVDLIAAALARRLRGAEGLRRFCDALGPRLLAWRIMDRDGQVIDSDLTGAEAAGLPVHDPAALTRQLDVATGGEGRDGLTLTGSAPGLHDALLAARSDGVTLLAALHPATDGTDTPDPIRLWREMLGA